MEADEYTRLAQQEDVHWWFGLLHRNLFAALDFLALSGQGLRCADFGCGTGGLIGELRNRFPTWSIVGVDRSTAAIELRAAKARFQFHCRGCSMPAVQGGPLRYNLFNGCDVSSRGAICSRC